MSSGRFNTDVYAARLRSAAAAAQAAGLAGLVITPGYDLRYLVGSRAQTFERLTALVVPADGSAPTVVVPRLELASLKESAILELGLAVRDWVDGDDPYGLVAGALPGSAVAVTDAMPALTCCRWRRCSVRCPCWLPRCCGSCEWSRTPVR